MKTTIEIPDSLFHRAKVYSAKHRITLKQLFIDSLEKALVDKRSMEATALTAQQSEVLEIDEDGVPVLKKRQIPPDTYQTQIDRLRNELGV